MTYTFSNMTVYIFHRDTSLDGLEDIEDYIFENLSYYSPQELKCLFECIEVKKKILTVGFDTIEQLQNRFKL